MYLFFKRKTDYIFIGHTGIITSVVSCGWAHLREVIFFLKPQYNPMWLNSLIPHHLLLCVMTCGIFWFQVDCGLWGYRNEGEGF